MGFGGADFQPPPISFQKPWSNWLCLSSFFPLCRCSWIHVVCHGSPFQFDYDQYLIVFEICYLFLLDLRSFCDFSSLIGHLIGVM